MTLQQLRYAITIADSTSMNEAAKQLFLSQQAVSKQVAAEPFKFYPGLRRRARHGAVHPQQPGNYADTGGQ